MTNEQLDEIEKLARDPKSAALHDLMARQTIPLVKALREAQVERDEAYRERADWMYSLDRSKADIITLMRERDEARAEVERLKGKFMEEARWVYDTGQRAKDALAEVERLREAIRGALTNGHMNALCWAQNDDACVGRCRLLREALGVHP